MTYLPTLLQKIDEFHRLAAKTLLQKTGQAWTMPDDPEEDTPEQPQIEPSGPGLYPQIVAKANEFSNQDIAEEILMIAELYRKALEINGGYALVNKMLSTALSNMDSLMDEGVAGENELEAAEDILNEVSQDLRQRAKTPGQINEATAMRDLKSARDAFNQKAIYEEVAAQPTVYEKGKPGAETGHNIGARPIAETPQKYAMEIGRLQDMANDPVNQNSRESISQLIGVLEQLIKQIPRTDQLKDELKITPEDTDKSKQLDQAITNLDSLRTQRRVLKQRLYTKLQNKELQDLQAKANATRNPDEKKWLEEKIRLQQIRTSGDMRRRKEVAHRQELIDATGTYDEHGDFRSQTIKSPEVLERILQGIREGEAQRLSRSQYDRELTKQRGKQLGLTQIPEREKQRGGWGSGERQQTDFSKATLPGLANKLRLGINTATDSARRYITSTKEGGKPELKSYVDAVSAAIRKKDNVAKYHAIRTLKEQMDQKMGTALKGYQQSLRLLPLFKGIERGLFEIADTQKEDGSFPLTPQEMEKAASIVRDIGRLKELYSQYYQSKGARKFRGEVKPRFEAVVSFLNVIEKYMLDNVLRTATPQMELPQTEQSMKLVSSIKERMTLLSKVGQEIIPADEIDQATADKIANDIYDQLFGDMVNKLMNQSD